MYNYKFDKILDLLNENQITDPNYFKALDPQTPQEELDKLIDHPDSRITGALASNPSISIKGIAKLAHKHPKEITNNPIIPILDLENPTWHHNISYNLDKIDRNNVVRGFPDKGLQQTEYVTKLMDHNPEYWSNKFSDSDDLIELKSLASHPNTSPEILHKLWSRRGYSPVPELLRNKNVTPEIIDGIADFAIDMERGANKASWLNTITDHQKTHLDTLKKIATIPEGNFADFAKLKIQDRLKEQEEEQQKKMKAQQDKTSRENFLNQARNKGFKVNKLK